MLRATLRSLLARKLRLLLASLAVLLAFSARRSSPRTTSLQAPAVVIATTSPPSPSVAVAPPKKNRRIVTSRTLLLAPEIFASEGGIPRSLQIYLKALCDLAEPDQAVKLLALNDSVVASSDLRRCAKVLGRGGRAHAGVGAIPQGDIMRTQNAVDGVGEVLRL